jgi:signal transduction histidine kinase
MMTSDTKPAPLAGLFFTASGFSIALSAGSLSAAFVYPSQRTALLSIALIAFLITLLFQAIARKHTLLSNNRFQKLKGDLILATQADDVIGRFNELAERQSNTDLVTVYQGLGNCIRDLHCRHVETLEKVTHDMRSLSASIIGYADLLSDTQFRCDEDTLNKCHQTIIQQGERIERLMDQAVIMTHLETGLTQIKRSTFSLDILLDGLVAETREQYGRKISFQNQIGEAIIYGDPLFLRMAILNLIDNGLRYSPVEETLEVILQPDSAPGWIELVVKDRGVGIEPDQQGILFSRFGRIRNNQNRKSVGSGMGLYLVKIIVQEHRGSVKVKSQPGQGSSFSISLPEILNLESVENGRALHDIHRDHRRPSGIGRGLGVAIEQ